MADLKAPERNPVIGRLADILLSGKESANTYEMKDWVPLVGGMGLGDMFMGKAPELADDASYNLRSLIRGGNQATGGLGTYTLDPRTADAAMLGADVAGIGAGLGGLSKRSASAIYDKLSSGGTSLSRRDALKKLGAITGSAAVTGGTLGAARKLLDNVATDVAPKIADNVAVQAAKKYKYNSLLEYINAIKNAATDEGSIAHAELGSDMPLESFIDDIWYHPDNPRGYDSYVKKALLNDERFYNEHKAAVAAGREPLPWSVEHNPKTNQFESIFADEVFSPQAKQELKNFKTTTTKLHTDYGGTNPNEQWLEWAINAPEDNPKYFTEVVNYLE